MVLKQRHRLLKLAGIAAETQVVNLDPRNTRRCTPASIDRFWRKAAVRILMDLECPLLGEEQKSLPTFKMTAFDPDCVKTPSMI
jgi:hypothetical protein